MMDHEPKKAAVLLMEKLGKGEPSEPEEDMSEGEGGIDAADALKDMYHSMKLGDFDAAAEALKAAMMACGD